MKFRTFIFIILVASLSVAVAQPRFQAGLDFTLGVPQTEFKDNVDNLGFGLSGQFGYNFPNTPFIIGGNMGFMIYGSETRKVPLIYAVGDLIKVDVTTTNSIFNAHLMFRVQPQQGVFRPYLDGLLGFNYLWTSTEVRDEDDFDEIASSTNQDDFTSCLGGGGGVMFCVYSGLNAEEKPFEVLIDFGVRYLNGGKAQYLKEGSIEINDGKTKYDLSESTTDLVTYQLGCVINF